MFLLYFYECSSANLGVKRSLFKWIVPDLFYDPNEIMDEITSRYTIISVAIHAFLLGNNFILFYSILFCDPKWWNSSYTNYDARFISSKNHV